MNPSFRRYGLISIALTLALCGCGGSDKQEQVIALTPDMHSICVGRFLIQLPRGMTNASANSSVRLYYGLTANTKPVDVTVESLNSSPSELMRSVEAQASNIARDDNWETKRSMLLEKKKLSDHSYYLRYHDDMAGAAGLVHEIHLLAGKTQLSLKAVSLVDIPHAGDFEPDGKPESEEKVDARLFRLASQVHSYGDPESAGPGICLGDAIINGDNDEEILDIAFLMPTHPDLSISIYSKELTPPGEIDPLPNRYRDLIADSHVHVLRKGATVLGNMPADEALLRIKDSDHGGIRLLKFEAASKRDAPALDHPYMTLELNAGGQPADSSDYVDASLTDDEAIALWDAIVKSIRLRPDTPHGKS